MRMNFHKCINFYREISATMARSTRKKRNPRQEARFRILEKFFVRDIAFLNNVRERMSLEETEISTENDGLMDRPNERSDR